MGCTTVSELQCAVGRTLHESCDDFESEIIDPQTLYSLDFASRAMRIAVEAAPAVRPPQSAPPSTGCGDTACWGA